MRGTFVCMYTAHSCMYVLLTNAYEIPFYAQTGFVRVPFFAFCIIKYINIYKNKRRRKANGLTTSLSRRGTVVDLGCIRLLFTPSVCS